MKKALTLVVIALLLVAVGWIAYAGTLKTVAKVQVTTGTEGVITIDPFNAGYIAFIQIEYAAAVSATNTIVIRRDGVPTYPVTATLSNGTSILWLPESHLWVGSGAEIAITNQASQTLTAWIGIEEG